MKYKTTIIHISHLNTTEWERLDSALNAPPAGYKFHSLNSCGDANHGGIVYTIIWESKQ